MTFLDKAKQALGQAKNKAGALADEHGDTIDKALDKGGSFIDGRTGGKYSDKIDKARNTAKEAADKLAAQHEAATSTRPTPPVEAADPIEPAQPIDPPDPLDPNRP